MIYKCTCSGYWEGKNPEMCVLRESGIDNDPFVKLL